MSAKKRGNPVQKRLRIEGLRKSVESILGSNYFSWWAIFCTVIILIIIAWIPDGFTSLIWGNRLKGVIEFGVALCLLIIIVFYVKRNTAAHYIVEVNQAPSKQTRHLVLFLSDMQQKEIEEILQDPTTITKGRKKWEMPYLAVQYHRHLESLYVITSDSTTKQFPLFRTFIRQAFPERTLSVEELTPGGIDFEDIASVFNGIEDFYHTRGIHKNDVLVDVTGGQKTNSIAGAIATLSVDRKFQYISARTKGVNSYDVGYFPREPESGRERET